jgi:transposase
MSLQPKPLPPLPEDTARLAKKIHRRKGNIYLTIGDQIGPLFDDIDFSDLYAADGAPALPPNLIALAVVFQRLEDLSDQDMADAVRDRISLKYALHLAADDPGFDGSVLSDFRQRLLKSEAALRMFDRLLARLQELGLVKGGGKQRTDGSYVLGATRLLNQVELLGETVRVALEALAAYRPDWLRSVALPHWRERYGLPWNGWRLPKSQEKRQQLALEMAADGYHLLDATAQPDAPSQAATLPEVVSLRQIWQQRLSRQDGTIQLLPRDALPPGAELVCTPHDPDVRAGVHGDHVWEGYGVHHTETCDDDLPHLLTDVTVVAATTPDVKLVDGIHARLSQRDLLPKDHYLDAGYSAGHTLVDSQGRGVRTIMPMGAESSWQARSTGGLTSDLFHIDWVRQQATCPQGHDSQYWSLHDNLEGQPVVDIRFPKTVCAACPVRERCTHSAGGRTLKVSIYHDAIVAQRRAQQSDAFKQEYTRRAGIEGTVSATVREHGARRSRYIGLAKTQLQALLTAMAVDLKRAALWLMAKTPATTRPPGLACLAAHSAP